eukprot:m.99227 g.99227  ORF g.99227 m.99227 type:complete len:464 (-) comp15095_c0_seq1:1198-2589(-)
MASLTRVAARLRQHGLLSRPGSATAAILLNMQSNLHLTSHLSIQPKPSPRFPPSEDTPRTKIDAILALAADDEERRKTENDLFRLFYGKKATKHKNVDVYQYLTDDLLVRETRYLLPDPRVPNSAQALTRKPRYENVPVGDPLRSKFARPESLAFFTGYADYYDLLENLDAMLDVLNSDEGLEAHRLAQGTMQIGEGSDDDDQADHLEQVVTSADNVDGDELDHLTAEANADDAGTGKGEIVETVDNRPMTAVEADKPHEEEVVKDQQSELWLTRDALASVLGSPLKLHQYDTIIEALIKLHSHEFGYLIQEQLSEFMRSSAVQRKEKKKKEVDALGRAYATGRRKDAVARVWVMPGSGNVRVNKKTLAQYFGTLDAKLHAIEPFTFLGVADKYDVMCTVKGGGVSGQAGAIRLGIARGLEILSPEYEPPLRAGNYLWRDPRSVERKKPGQRKARRKFQWVKR